MGVRRDCRWGDRCEEVKRREGGRHGGREQGRKGVYYVGMRL